MKIDLSCISGSGDDIGEFMKKIDAEVSLMSSLPATNSTLGQVLNLAKAIIDQISLALHLSSLNLMIADWLIEVVRHTRYSGHRGPLFSVLPGCRGDGSPRWYYTRTSWHIARNAGYCKDDS